MRKIISSVLLFLWLNALLSLLLLPAPQLPLSTLMSLDEVLLLLLCLLELDSTSSDLHWIPISCPLYTLHEQPVPTHVL